MTSDILTSTRIHWSLRGQGLVVLGLVSLLLSGCAYATTTLTGPVGTTSAASAPPVAATTARSIAADAPSCPNTAFGPDRPPASVPRLPSDAVVIDAISCRSTYSLRPDGARWAGVVEQRIDASDATALSALTDLLHRADAPTNGGSCTSNLVANPVLLVQTATGWEQVRLPIDACSKPIVAEYSTILGFASDGTVVRPVGTTTTRWTSLVESAARVRTGCSEWKDLFNAFLLPRTTGTLIGHPGGSTVSAWVVSLTSPERPLAASEPTGDVTISDTHLSSTGTASSSAVTALLATMAPADGTGCPTASPQRTGELLLLDPPGGAASGGWFVMVEIGGCGRVLGGNSYQVAGRLPAASVASLVALASDM